MELATLSLERRREVEPEGHEQRLGLRVVLVPQDEITLGDAVRTVHLVDELIALPREAPSGLPQDELFGKRQKDAAEHVVNALVHRGACCNGGHAGFPIPG